MQATRFAGAAGAAGATRPLRAPGSCLDPAKPEFGRVSLVQTQLQAGAGGRVLSKLGFLPTDSPRAGAASRTELPEACANWYQTPMAGEGWDGCIGGAHASRSSPSILELKGGQQGKRDPGARWLVPNTDPWPGTRPPPGSRGVGVKASRDPSPKLDKSRSSTN